jgi:hypothetical protein
LGTTSISIIREAEKAGYTTLVLDSITHEWNGSGGILEIVDAVSRSKYKGNSYAAWNEGTPRHQKFVDAMLQSSLHIIATMRSKARYIEKEENGKKKITKEGAEPQQRDGLEYEFTAVLDLSVDGNFANASKDRTRLFRDPFVITDETGRKLLDWLNTCKRELLPPVQRLNMDAVNDAFSVCRTIAELNAALKKLGIDKHHPDAPAVAQLYNDISDFINEVKDMQDSEVF